MILIGKKYIPTPTDSQLNLLLNRHDFYPEDFFINYHLNKNLDYVVNQISNMKNFGMN